MIYKSIRKLRIEDNFYNLYDIYTKLLSNAIVSDEALSTFS
jgi:hypothetical protein